MCWNAKCSLLRNNFDVFLFVFCKLFDSSRVEYCFISRVQCKYLNIVGHSNEYRVNKYSVNPSNRFFFTFFFQNLIDLKLTVWKRNNERSVFFLIQQKCSLFSYAAYGWMTLRIFNQSVKNSLHNFWSFYQIREKTALSFVDFIKVYFFICNDLQCVEYAL